MAKESKSIMIEAKLRGPGPGRYGLPATCGQTGHDFSKHMKPAFSFGGQLPLKNNVRPTLVIRYSLLFRYTVRVQSTLSKMKLQDSVKTELLNILNWGAEKNNSHSKHLDLGVMKIISAIHKVNIQSDFKFACIYRIIYILIQTKIQKSCF